MSHSITIDHVGPIEHLEIPVPEDGGVVVLRGKCGEGKTHAIQSVASLHDTGARKSLRVTDGFPSGKIEGLGVTVRLGRSNTGRGNLVCESLDSGVDPSLLVDPGLKDPLAADSRRLATLVRLANIRVPVDKWAELAGVYSERIAVKDLVTDDPVKSADSVRRRLHEYALSIEKQGNSKVSEGTTLYQSMNDVDDGPDDKEQLARAVSEAAAAVNRAEAGRESFVAAAAAHANAKLQLENLRANILRPEDCERREADCQANLVEAQKEVKSWAEKVQRLEAELAAAKSELNLAKADEAERADDLQDAKEITETARKQAKDLAVLEKAVADQLPETVSDEQLQALRDAEKAALQAAQNGEVIRRAKQTRSKGKLLAEQGEALLSEAEAIRSLARSTDTVLEQALIDAGFDQVKVLDGRLCVVTDRGHEPVSELSTGQRWRLALDIAACALPSGGLLSVHQEGWQSLDSEFRREVAAMARERKLVIVTAQVDDGDMRVEVVQ